MAAEHSVEELDRELATAVGLYALTDAGLHEAAAATDVTVLEVEMAMERAGLDDIFDLSADGDVSKAIDDLLDDQ
jgi:hypothetical protein